MREHDGEKTAAAIKGIESTARRRTRRRWSEEEKRQLVEQWKRSEQSRVVFSREKGLCYAAFLRWTQETAAGECGRFMEVKIKRAPAGGGNSGSDVFELAELVAPNGWRIRLPQEFNARRIQEVIDLVASC